MMTEREKRNLMRLMADANEARMRMVNPLGSSLVPLSIATAIICPAGLMFLIWALDFGGR
jgi:hypothetical protein